MFRIQTANGVVTSDKYFLLYVPNIGEFDCVVLKRTPDLLSMGKLIERFKLKFVWDGADYDHPYLESKDGDRINLTLDRDVPYLNLNPKSINVTPAMYRIRGKQTVSAEHIRPAPEPLIPLRDARHREYIKSISHLNCGCKWCRIAKARKRPSRRNKTGIVRSKNFGQITMTDTYEPTVIQFKNCPAKIIN